MNMDTNAFANLDTHQSFVMLISMNAKLTSHVTSLYVLTQLVWIISALAGRTLTVGQHNRN